MARSSTARHGTARHGTARHGTARHGTAPAPRSPRWLAVFYAAAAFVGTLGPWLFFGSYFARTGFHPPVFVADLFVDGAAGGFALDVLIAIVVFLVWSWSDARRHQVRHWWAVIPLSCLVGLSSALPVHLPLRTRPVDPSAVGS